MHPPVQIDLPPYTDYASLEQKLTLAVECVSVPSRYFTCIDTITFAGRLLDLVRSREYLVFVYLTTLHPSPIRYLLSLLGRSSSLSCLPRLLPVLASSFVSVLWPHVHDHSISFLDFRFGSARLVSDTTAYLVDSYLCATKA